MSPTSLPSEERLYRALVERDAAFEGVFVFGVTSTAIACRPTCPARKPKRENVRFFAELDDALAAGFRACLRCRPDEWAGRPPAWIRPLLSAVAAAPDRRFTAADLESLGLAAARVRRWFQATHGESFAAWQRRRRVARAGARVADGADLLSAGMDADFDSDSGFREAFAKLHHAPPGAVRRSGARPTWLRRLPSPLGALLAAAGDDGLCLLEFGDEQRLPEQLERLAQARGPALAPGEHPVLDALTEQLEAYFAGDLRRFSLPLAAHGTPFQQAVWAQLRAIPYGTTASYADIAGALGRPGAQRAVGRANGSNPIAIVVPCHRVVRADGQLSGYAGGVWRKARLLALEGARRDDGEPRDSGQGALPFG